MTRLYVTVPGDAQPSFTIDSVKLSRDSKFFPHQATLQIFLRNTGRVRLHPTVMVDGHRALGSDLLMSKSVERYVATVKVPFYGGPLSYRIVVPTKVGNANGPVQALPVSTFVFPWVLLLMLAGFVLLVLAGRRLLRKRGKRYTNIQADLRRMEKLLADQRSGTPQPVVAAPAPEPVVQCRSEPVVTVQTPEPAAPVAAPAEPSEPVA